MEKKTSSDLDLLQGTWSVTSLEMDGTAVPGIGNSRLVVKGNRFKSTGMGAIYEGTLVIDSSVTPRQLDMKFDAGPEKGNTNYGIYQLGGDNWKICVNTLGGARPESFETASASGCALETLVRGEIPAPKKTHTTKEALKPTARPATELEGEWKMVSGILDGRVLDASMVRWVKRINEGNMTTVTAGPQTMLKAEFTVSGSGSLKTIDYVHLAGANKGKIQLGIYTLDGKELRIFMAAAGAARPVAFPSSAGWGETLTVWTRS
jgi:uncharacterized protein (TIGR03067 family)